MAGRGLEPRVKKIRTEVQIRCVEKIAQLRTEGGVSEGCSNVDAGVNKVVAGARRSRDSLEASQYSQ